LIHINILSRNGGVLPRRSNVMARFPAPPVHATRSSMTQPVDRQHRRGAVALAELVGKVLAPVTAKRGFATADLMAAWAEIVGPRYAGCTRPERVAWPRGEPAGHKPAVLVLRVEGPRAILVQHEAGQIIERVNAFLGYAAIGQMRIVQGPVAVPAGARKPEARALRPAEENRLAAAVSDVADGDLRQALARLGRGVLADSDAEPVTGGREETP
jgi:hypothetical protein